MDTIRLIKINDTQLYIEINSDKNDFSKKIEVNFKVEQIKSLSQKIYNDIFKNYVKNGILDNQFNQLKELSFELFNILDLYRLESYFKNQKSQNEIVHLHIIIDPQLNFIPFEILHDGKDFLSDYLILSREFTNSNFQNSNHKINSKEKFCVIGNPSESKDINDDIINEIESISSVIDLDFNLRGPFKHRNVDKIELIRLLGVNNGLHFSGHYGLNGWKLFDEEFLAEDILKCSRTPEFVFSNSCGNYNESFIDFLNAFLNKGTKSIICSFGDLPSNKAAEFSEYFYKFLITHNNNMGKALFLSRKEMIKKYGYKDLFWAFYQLYGSSLLSINKKNIFKSKSLKSIFPKSIFLITLLSAVIFTIYYIFGVNKYQTELNIKYNSNIHLDIKDTTLFTGKTYNFLTKDITSKDISSKYYPVSLMCDSIINEKPYFSLNSGPKELNGGRYHYQQIFRLILDNIDNNLQSNQMIVRFPYKFDNDLLTTFFIKKDNFHRLELFFEDDIEYSVYLRQSKRGFKEFFTFHIVSDNNLSYKIDLNELLQIPLPIHKDHLNNYLDKFPTDFPRNSEFEYIKNEFKFRNYLIIDIKKALKY